jgi:hypothetical protein
MKLPKNMSTTKTSKRNLEEEHVSLDLGTPSTFSYFYDDFENDKHLMRYIKSIESLVRSSFEYRNYIKYLKEEQDLTGCKFFTKIDGKNIRKVSIEFHHYPFNLYEIVETVLKKQTNDYENPAYTFDIANEVARLHYENMIGLVPLSKTVHELAHAGEIFINFDLVFGDVQKFIDDYNDYIDEELLTAINKLSLLSEKNTTQSNNYILKKKFQSLVLEDRKIEPYVSKNKEIKLA